MRPLDDTRHWAIHLARQAEVRPNDTAFEFTGAAVGGTLSYGELHRRAIACATAWRDRVGEGDRVLLCLPPGAGFMIALFGCFYAGAVAVPVPPPLASAPEPGRAWFRSLVADARPRAVIWSSAVADSLAPTWHEIADGPAALTVPPRADPTANWRPPTPSADALAIILYTSGSTGAPKGVEIRHESLLHNMRAFAAACGRGSGDRIYTWLPNVHIAGLYTRLLGVFLGCPTLVATPADFLQSPLEWLRTISRWRATISAAPNFAYDLAWQAAEGQDLRELDLSCWAMAVTGGEVVRLATYQRFVQRFAPSGFRPAAFHPYYGLTETLCTTIPQRRSAPTILHVDRSALRDNRVVATEADSSDVLALVGNGGPLGDGVIAIVDPDTGRRCPVGTIGEIWTADPSNTHGYWGRPELSTEVCHARLDDDRMAYFRTGDLGFVHDGELFVTGRRKELIIIHGKNYYPQDIEATILDAAPGVSACAAFAVDDGKGELLAVAVECEASTNLGALARDLRAAVHARHGLTIHRLALLTAQRLPRTSTQKIQRAACRELLSGGAWAPSEPARPGLDHAQPDTWPAAIAAFIAAEIERRTNVAAAELNLDESLAGLGLDSVAIVELALAVREFCGPRVPVQIIDFYGGASVAELADRLGNHRDRPAAEHQPDHAADVHLVDAVLAEQSAPTTSGDAVLLTGATGFLGRYLLHALLTATDRPVICLVRAADADAASRRIHEALATGPGDRDEWRDRIEALPGDLLAPNFGLGDAEVRRLAERVGTIVHNAANVDFIAPYARLRTSNVLPTLEMIRLARRGSPKQLHYISTTAVFNSPERSKRERLLETDQLDDPRLIQSGYAQSKWVSEAMLGRAREAGLAVGIHRPAQVTGDARSGYWNTDDFLCRFIKGCLQMGRFPDLDLAVDMVPVDYVAQAIVAIIGSGAAGDYNLSHPRPIGMKALFQWYAAAGHPSSPEPLSRWLDRLAGERGNVLVPMLPFLEARSGGHGPTILELLDREPPDKLDTSNARGQLLAAGIEPPAIDDSLLHRYTDYFRASGFFRELTR